MPLGVFIMLDPNYSNKYELRKTYAAYGYRRIDFLVISTFGDPILAIEYNGSGHYKDSDYEMDPFNVEKIKQRDSIKAKALELAGIALYVVKEDIKKHEVQAYIKATLSGYYAKHMYKSPRYIA